MTEVIFDEDTSMLQPLPPEIKIPDKGFEGWFYKKFPGGYFFKKALLIAVIVALFAASFVFFALGKLNVDGPKSFEERAKSTRI
jgi:hypothetical protein